MAAVVARAGANPVFELETGRLTAAAFLKALGDQLTTDLRRPAELHGFGERYLEHLDPDGKLRLGQG